MSTHTHTPPIHGPLRCTACGTWEQATHFRWRSNGERNGCRVQSNLAKRARRKTPEGRRQRRFEKSGHRYGLSKEQHTRLVEHNPVCAVCSTTENLCIDHCHNTLVVRGRLCVGCNAALGCAKDNPATLRALADYLENTRPKPWQKVRV